ncbi:DEAD-domain-containing protein [Zopfia rhizophila CBS 207.26]|uniref:RNA helicase n=1 Tax=Zopfia rhizophila CBS 207.26 TaxID=1314779 RepID=A0A6A6DRN6_9PEZI|nr:DEAD-domain-containing protein [Zopfia rhizophila CBS 207.26]
MKRNLPLKVAAIKTRKRRKIEQAVRPTPSNPAKRSSERRTVRLDDLQWKEVSMPDRLDDFEGFFGLEEIEEVDVFRDGATGKISFQTSKPAKDTQRQVDVEDANGTQHGGSQENAGEKFDDDEWSGFSEEEEEVKEERPQEPELPRPSTSPSGQVKLKAKQKRGKKSGEPLPMEGAFDILTDEALDVSETDEVDVSAWGDLGLSGETLSSLSKLKFSQPTPIQASAIPEILAGHDVIGKASTGSGKTLAFGIPILESFLASRLKPSGQRPPLALIVSPTRELAHQLTAHLTALCSSNTFDGPSIATITGGLSVQKQRRLLTNADVVIGTPGRLWEVISMGQGLIKSFRQIRFLVVDEADRLLSEGHYKEMEEILNILERFDEEDEEDEGPEPTIPEVQRQTLVFSATFHKGLQQKLAGKGNKGGDLMNKQESMEYLLKKLRFREEKPKLIDVNPTHQMASGLKEGLIECAGTEKDLYLYALLLFHSKKRSLIFTNSISAVRRLSPFLQNLNLPALPLHSQMPQKARLRSVERFTAQPGSILVATDVAARGLDIPGVQLIVHYHLPRAADTYVHRSGRTARAEASGTSILICAPEEVAGVRRLVAKVHAQSKSDTKLKKTAYFIRSLDIDRRIVSRLKPRAILSKRLADAVIAKEKKHKEDEWLREAAEDLGVNYDSETFEAEAPGRRGRGSGRKKKEKEAGAITKSEMQALRAELKGLLSQRVNVGVSERYLTRGGVDVDALLNGTGNGEFLGIVDSLGFDEV